MLINRWIFRSTTRLERMEQLKLNGQKITWLRLCFSNWLHPVENVSASRWVPSDRLTH